MKNKKSFDKYFYYKESVQNPKDEILFFKKTYKSFFKRTPRVFREDFCGTFYIGYEWVKAHPKNKAIVVDKDSQPLLYGKKHHLSKLTDSQKSRLRICNTDVLNQKLPGAEIISVNNFSYFIFKQRSLLLKYFKNAKRALAKQGLFIIDTFGGSECFEDNSERVEHKGFHYYWEQKNFNPISHQAQFYIHFKRRGEKKRERVFSYDWRLWSLPELKDILEEAGFSSLHVYWEQSDKNGEGTGFFKKSLKGEACETWIAYLVCKV